MDNNFLSFFAGFHGRVSKPHVPFIHSDSPYKKPNKLNYEKIEMNFIKT